MRRGVKLSVAESAPQSQLLLQGLSVAVQKIKGRSGRSCNQNYPTTTPAKFSSDRKVQKTLKEKTWFMTFFELLCLTQNELKRTSIIPTVPVFSQSAVVYPRPEDLRSASLFY